MQAVATGTAWLPMADSPVWQMISYGDETEYKV